MLAPEYLLQFLREDAPSGDLTSDAIIPDISCHAVIRAEQDGIIAGLEEAATLFSYNGAGVTIHVKDGGRVNRGMTLISVDGKAKTILLVERTALNIIGRMSGIATQTRKMIDIVTAANPRCRVAGTRKTSPGCRSLDKKAVLLGGGDPHRSGLSDGILIKDNHLLLVPLSEAVRSAKKATVYRKIEIEAGTTDDALNAAREGADIIMLDNMTPDQIRETIGALMHEGRRDDVTIELSGGIDERNIGMYADLGADVISLGALTHSARNFSVNLEIVP
jgi:nicotinate-nucleotide pyrophosphorylase (carboxylating)